MSKIETAVNLFDSYNCAQAVLCAHAADYDLDMNKALQTAVGFGGGLGRLGETCGAVSGAIMVLGLRSSFKEGDGRDKINAVYDKVRRFIAGFEAAKGTVKCRELLGCDLNTEEGQKFFKDNKLRENCRGYIRLCCELLEKE